MQGHTTQLSRVTCPMVPQGASLAQQLTLFPRAGRRDAQAPQHGGMCGLFQVRDRVGLCSTYAGVGAPTGASPSSRPHPLKPRTWAGGPCAHCQSWHEPPRLPGDGAARAARRRACTRALESAWRAPAAQRLSLHPPHLQVLQGHAWSELSLRGEAACIDYALLTAPLSPRQGPLRPLRPQRKRQLTATVLCAPEASMERSWPNRGEHTTRSGSALRRPHFRTCLRGLLGSTATVFASSDGPTPLGRALRVDYGVPASAPAQISLSSVRPRVTVG